MIKKQPGLRMHFCWIMRKWDGLSDSFTDCLPGFFSGCRILRSREFSVLLGDGSEEIKVPFGLPLQRVQQGNLLIPRHTRIIPEVSWPLLTGRSWTEGKPYDNSDSGAADCVCHLMVLSPLSKSLISGVDPREIKVEIVPPEALPEFHWDFPEITAEESTRMIKGSPTRGSCRDS